MDVFYLPYLAQHWHGIPATAKVEAADLAHAIPTKPTANALISPATPPMIVIALAERNAAKHLEILEQDDFILSCQHVFCWHDKYKLFSLVQEG